MSVLTGRRAVLRLAARDARRHRGRSALVVVMVALPVLVLSAVDVVARTDQAAQLGGADQLVPRGEVDAIVRVVEGPVLQDPTGTSWTHTSTSMSTVDPGTRSPDQVADDLDAQRVIVDQRTSGRYAASDGSRRLDLRLIDAADPLADGAVEVLTGRLAQREDEVAVTDDVLRLAGLELGGTLELTRPERALTVVGTVGQRQYQYDAPTAVLLPGAVEAEPQASPFAARFFETTYLVDAAAPVTWSRVMELNEQGYVVTSRAVLDDPPARSEVPYFAMQDEGSSDDGELAALIALAAGMALLEVVLLAGPAVAVGARRSRRLLALVAACGGDRRQVRDVVLAQGLVLGGVAAVVGVGGGVLLGVAAVPALERFTEAQLAPPVIRPLDLLLLAAVAAVTAVLASVVPARSVSRQDTALALAGRREPLRTRKRIPVLGLVLAAAGLALVVQGIDGRSPVTILAGAALGQIGLVLCTPTLVAVAGRLGKRLPLTPRMALRDGARHVGRTAPAVSAVMAAVAGSVAIGIFVASQSEHDRLQYTPSLPLGDASVYVDPTIVGEAELSSLLEVLERELPVQDAAVVRSVDSFGCAQDVCTSLFVETPDSQQCPAFLLDRAPSQADLEAVSDDPRCTVAYARGGRTLPFTNLVDDGDVLALLLGRDDPEARAALARGDAVVLDPLLVEDGVVRLGVVEADRTGSRQVERQVDVPAVAIAPPEGTLPGGQVVLSPATAEALGVPGQASSAYLRTSRMPTAAEEERANTALDLAGFDAQVGVERGYQNSYLPGLLALVIGAAVITLGAAATATGLAMTDARPDLATLAAVGATRSVRRRLSMSTSLVITLLGTALGVLAGAVPGVAAVRALQQPDFPTLQPDNGWPLVIPWPSLAVTVVAVPLVAALGAAVFTRARLPMTRRAAT